MCTYTSILACKYYVSFRHSSAKKTKTKQLSGNGKLGMVIKGIKNQTQNLTLGLDGGTRKAYYIL